LTKGARLQPLDSAPPAPYTLAPLKTSDRPIEPPAARDEPQARDATRARSLAHEGPPAGDARIGTLDNGLRVLTVDLPHLHSGLVSVYVRAGSRHESAQDNGVCHFLEHLFFRGSQGYPDGRAMNALVEDVGGDLNGVTCRDHGFYTSPVHPARLDVPFEVLGDMLARPLFKDIELEREVILEEILDEVDEDGRDIDVDNLAKRALFEGHPLSLKIAGTRESVAVLGEERLRAHHTRAYGARNLVLACAGPLDHGAVMQLAARTFGALPEGEPLVDDPPPEPAQRGPQLVLVDHKESQTQVSLCFRAPPERHPDFPALRVIRRILSDGLASRMQSELVEKRALAYSVGASMDAFSDTAVFDLGAACAPKKAPAVAQALLELVGELCDREASEEELARARRKSRIRIEFMRDSPSDLVEWWGTGELLHAPAEGLGEWLGRIEAVTAHDVRRAARQWLRKDRLVACVVGPLGAQERKLRDLLESAAPLPAGEGAA
jgi:predicted Zn-dependent peptidase